ncbi:MAG: hypothetical protein U0640_08895 [Phycisphaerales bacterium]
MAQNDTQGSAKKWSTGKKIVVGGGVGVVVVLGLGILLAPTIAGAVAPGLISSNAAKFVKGKVSAKSASFSWGGPQRVEGISWVDEKGQPVLATTVSTSAGLIGLISGGLDLGEVEIRDTTAQIVRAKDGTLNVQSLMVEQKGAGNAASGSGAGKDSGKPIQLPNGLKVRLSIENLDATFVDESAQTNGAAPLTVKLSGVEGNATVDPKTNLVAKLVANANSSAGGTGSGASGAGGKINVDIDAANWADGSGVVTLDKATVKAKVDVANLPMSLVDAIAGPVVKDENGVGVPLAKSLGNAVQLNIDANGTMKDATAVLKFVTDRANANGELRIADGVLTTSKPLTISLQGAAVPDLVPAMRAALKSDAQTRVEAMPDATVTVDNLRIVLPQGGKALDLRGASANVAVATTEVRGTVVASGQTQAMKISPLNATFSASDFAQGATISAKTTATLNNQPAGDLDVQASLTGLLDAAGAPVKGLPSGVNASVKVKQIATAVAQPFVQGMNLDLQRDIGPTLDVDLKAVSAAAQGMATAPINIDFTVNAAAMRGNGALTLREDALLARDKGVTFEVDAAGRLAEAITRDGVGGGWRVSGTGGSPGKASVKIGWLNLPLTAEKSPRLEAADGQLVVAVEGLTLTKMEVDSAGKIGTKVLGAVDVPQFGGGFALKKGGALDVGMQGKLRYAGQDSGIGANFSVPGVVIANSEKNATKSWMVAEPITLRPEGGVEIVNLPVGMFVASDGSDGTNAANSGGAAGTATEKKLDIAALLRDVIGPGVTIRANTKKGASGDLALEALADSGAMKFNTKANLSEASIAMSELELRCTLTPQSADAVFARLAPENKDMPKLASPATAVVTVSPLTIPLDKDRKPKLAEAGTVKARVALPGRVMVRDIRTGETQRASAGIEEFVLDVEAPVASLISTEQGGTAGSAKATFKGNVIRQQNENLAALSGDGTFQLAGGKPQQMKVTANLAQINTGSIDTLLGKDGLVRGALGDSASVKVIADVDSVKNDTSAEIAITAPNVTTTGPLKVRSLVDRIELVQPARFTVQAQPSFVEALFKPSTSIPTSGKEVKEAVQAALALKQPTTIDISLNKLVLPKAPAAGAKAPAPDVNVLLDIPSLALRTSDNKGLNVNKTKLTLETAASSGAGSTDKPLNFALTMDQVVVEGAEQSSSGGGVSLTGNVTNMVGADGGFSMDGAILNARGTMPSVPTALVDVLAKKDGLLVEALGPVIELNLVAERYPLMGKPIAGIAPGLLDLQAKSARANASVKGNISDAVLVCDQPVTANLLEISAALAGRVVKGLPLLGTFEKLREDRPASITATGLRVPLSNDLSKLGGVVVIDPGQLRFGAGSEFTKLLNLAKVKTSGSVGTRLEPLTITVTNGVASYPKWRVPLGEFTMETEGTVDLVNRRVDVVTWIPLGALADEAAGIFNTGAGGKLNQILGDAVPVLDAASMLPFRTKGSMDDPETGADLELFGKTFVKNLRPDKLIEKGLGDLFKKKDK